MNTTGEEELGCAPPSSVLKPLGYCIETAFTFFPVDFPTRRRLLLCFKRVYLGFCESGFLLVHQMVMGLQLQSSVSWADGKQLAARLGSPGSPSPFLRHALSCFLWMAQGAWRGAGQQPGRRSPLVSIPLSEHCPEEPRVRQVAHDFMGCAVLYDHILFIATRLAVV